MQDKLGVKPKLRIGKPGSLDVIVDGKTVFSKPGAGPIPSLESMLASIPHGNP